MKNISSILKGQRMGNSVSVPLTKFGIEMGKKYLVARVGDKIIIEEFEENGNL